jgi:catechol 2,3-dioxygenase-like lactoylglutathione lyase family enzyme
MIQLIGLHHVTAISAKITDNVEFYTNILDLRLV